MAEKQKKIYLVEDDPAITDIYATMLKKAKFGIEVLALGQDVLKKVKKIESGEEQSPDLILLDLTLPDINGVEVLREIRNNKATKGIKVFIFSNQENTGLAPDDPVQPDKFIVKANITPTQLIEMIKEQFA